MNLYDTVVDFFDVLISYIKLLIGYLEDANISKLLNYLWLCIPEEVRAILIVLLLLMLILGIRKAVKG